VSRIVFRLFPCLLAAVLAGCGDSSPDSAFGPAGADRSAGGAQGPVLTLSSNLIGSWASGEPGASRDVFAGNGLRFFWSAVPGKSGSPVAGYGYAVDGSAWSPFEPDLTEWPSAPNLWFPDAGSHSFAVRAIDDAGNVTTVTAELVVFAGPGFCPPEERFVLVVLDTDPAPLVAAGIWPADFADVERSLAKEWFAGSNFQIWETGGTQRPPVSLMNCASSTFWLVGSDVAAGAPSVLESYHLEDANSLQAYSAAGGNVFLAGVRPSEAMRWFQAADDGDRVRQDYPVAFSTTLDDPTWVPHWAATRLPIGEVERSVGGGRSDAAGLPRITLATSEITGGANPYPDLPWDPARWSGGTRGFGYFDDALTPENGEVAYRSAGSPVGVRRLVGPGPLGNAVFLGFHPYFVDDVAFRALIRAVLVDFGEPTDPGL